MKLKHLIFYLLTLVSLQVHGSRNQNKKYLIVELDNAHANYQVGYNLCKTQDSLKKDIYILNLRYKLNETPKSVIGSDADFIFVFYVLPNHGSTKLVQVNQSDSIKNQKGINLKDIRDSLTNTGIIDQLNFIPIISYGGKLYKFINADIFGQAFILKENLQYFPGYGQLSSSRYELNFLSKPYTDLDIKLLRKEVVTDTSGIKRFDYDGFDGRWNIKTIDKSKKTIDFWIHFWRVATGAYSFGRFAEEIRFKLNVGVTDFKVEPLRPIFDEKHMFTYEHNLVKFNFMEFIDLKSMIKN